MSRVAGLAGPLGLLGLLGCVANQPVIQFGMVTDPARTAMELAWSEHPDQAETAWCVTGWLPLSSLGQDSATIGGEHIGLSGNAREQPPFIGAVVYAVKRAPYESATNAGVNGIHCGDGVPVIHTHTPTTCDTVGRCRTGGPDAWQCAPSREDYRLLLLTHTPYGVVQCDRHGFVFYWRRHYG